MAIAVLALVAERRRMGWWALLPAGSAPVIVVPGVGQDEGDLDAKWINVVPALGVAIVLVLTLPFRLGRHRGDAARRPRSESPSRSCSASSRSRGSSPRSASTSPGPLFFAKQQYEGHASVHLGEHHGFEGYVLVPTALLTVAGSSREHAGTRTPSPRTSR